MPRTRITRHDIILECPSVNPLGLSARYIPYCSGAIPIVDDVEEALDALKAAIDAGDISLLVVNEIPSGLVNGFNLLFTTLSNFASGTLQVHLNGLRLKDDQDYAEGPGADEFTMDYPPHSPLDDLIVDYRTGA